jgi:A/G-specific adenine glycosylase
MWQGLGYNSRARNLLKTARLIAEKYNGKFPDTIEEIRALPGIGDYTAAAICSFAFEIPKPVIDANVIRLFSRLWGIEALSTSAAMRQQLEERLLPLIIQTAPSAFNQAIMDFGALQCKARNPLCETCPFGDSCFAFRHQAVTQYPRTPEKKPRKQRFLHYLVLTDDDSILLRKRPAGDIWTSMYDFPVLETSSTAKPLNEEHVLPGIRKRNFLLKEAFQSRKYRQTLTHQEIHAWFYEHPVELVEEAPEEGYYLVKKKNLKNFAFPKLIYCYLQDKSIL